MENSIEHGPWEKYQQPVQSEGPWTKYQNDKSIYVMSTADRRRVHQSFAGDPLAFIADPAEKDYVTKATEALPDRDDYRKRMALAAYLTTENPGSDFLFVLHNLDPILEKFYKKKMTVEQAYADLAKLYAPEEVSVAKEFGKVLAEGAKEHGLALASGGIEFAGNLASAAMRFGAWDMDMRFALLYPILPDSWAKKLKEYTSDLLKNYGNKIRHASRDLIEKDVRDNANPDFLTDLVTGDFEKVSTTDFTKALIRSAPNMAFQIGLAAISPWALPAFIGAEKTALTAYEVEEKQPDWGTLKKWGYIALSAANEALFEFVTGKILGSTMTKKAAAQVMQQGILKFMGQSFAKEGSSEGAQQLLANINDLLFDLEGDAAQLNTAQLFGRTFNGVLESAFIGGVWGLPEGVIGYTSARSVMGEVQRIRQEHEQIQRQLSAKEMLTQEEKVKLETAEKIAEADTPQDVLALHHAAQSMEKANDPAEVVQSDDYAAVKQTAAADTEEETMIEAVQAQRRMEFARNSAWNPQDVADKVQEYSTLFKDTTFHLVDHWEDLGQFDLANNHPGGAFTDLRTGDIYINTSRIRPEKVLEIMLHEVVGHKGLRAIVPESDLDPLLDQVYRDHADDDAFRDIAWRYFPEARQQWTDEDGAHAEAVLNDVKDQRLAAEEYIAHIAETPQKPSWWKELLQKIRMWWQSLRGTPLPMTDDQISTLIARSSRKMRQQWYNRRSRVVQGNRRFFTDLKTGEEQGVTELKKLDHSQYQENTMLSGDEDIALIDIPRANNTVYTAEKEIAEKIKKSGGHLIAVNEDQNMRILIQSNNSLDEAASEKAVKETLSDGTSAEIHAAALANIEKLLSKARLGASHRDWHTYAKNQQRGTNKETALQIHRFYSAMQYGDDIYGVKMTVREKQNGSTVFYTLEAHDLDIEKITPETESSRGGVVKAALPGRSPAIQFSAFFEKFKPVDDLLGLKYKNKYPDVRFSVAPVLDLSLEGEEDKIENDFDGKLLAALQDTLNAENFYGERFDSSFTPEEWNGYSEEERKQIIRDRYAEDQQDELTESSHTKAAEHGHKLYEALEDALDLTADFAGENGFEVWSKNINSNATSAYLKLYNPATDDTFIFRFSDHEQPGSGSLYTNKRGDTSREKADLSIVIQNDKLDLAPAWKLIQDHRNEHIRFALEEYPEEDRRDIVKILKPFTGHYAEREAKEYQAYLKSKGVDIPVQDAWEFAVEAARENMQDSRRRGIENRNQWLYDNFPLYREIVDFTGSTDFLIKPAHRFTGEEFTGSFISPEFRKYSEKRVRGPKTSEKQYRNYLALREKKLANADGHSSDELAEAIARKWGRDALEVEQEIIDFFRNLSKKEFYKHYTDWKHENLYADKLAQQEAMEEFLQQEKMRIEDEVVDILQHGQEITPEWIFENRAVYKELYRKIFKGKEAPYSPSQKDLEAINAALKQEGSNASAYAEAYKAARTAAWKEYQEKLSKLRDKVMQSREDAITLQRDAIAFAEENIPAEHRAEFIRNVITLQEYPTTPSAKYPEGRRMHEFRNLQNKITQRAADIRKQKALDRIATRLQQLGERVDSGRKARGVRDIATQNILNRIIQISRMDGVALNQEIMAKQAIMEEKIERGESTLDEEYDIALLNRYGELWNKSADEVESAYRGLQLLAKTGKDNLLAAIQRRIAEDEAERQELWEAVNGRKKYSVTELQKVVDKWKRRGSFHKVMTDNFWKSLSMDGILEAVALFSNSYNVVTRIRRLAHKAQQDKDSMNRNNSKACMEFLKKVLKTDSSFAVAETIGSWREKRKSGVVRFVPDRQEKTFKFEKLEIDDARKLLAAYDAGNSGLTDYEAEAIRQQLSTIDRKVKYEVPEEFRDGATDKLVELIRQDQDEKKVYVVIPRRTGAGTMEELELSQMQALYLRLMWDQKDIRYKMHYNGYSEDSMRQLDQFLLPEVKELGKWMVEELEKDRGGIEKVYNEIYFANFPKEENYFPGVYQVSGNRLRSNMVDLTQEGAASGAISYTPGALKVRVYHLKEPQAVDALTVFQNHRLLMNHFVSHAIPGRKLRSILLDQNIKEAIEGVHGVVAYRELKSALKDFMNGGNTDVEVSQAASWLYSAAVRSKMAFNLGSGLKQTLGGITYLQEIPGKEFLQGLYYAAKHPQEVIKTLAYTDYFRNRWKSGANADLRMILDEAGKQGSKAAEWFRQVDQIGSLALRLGDAAAVLFGGYSVYKYHYDNLIKQGMRAKEARQESLLRWEMATERTQQSSSPFLLNRYQRGGFGLRLFTTFMSNQILLWNHNAPAVYKAMVYGTKAPLKDVRMGLKALILASAAMTAFDQLKDHWNDGEYEWMNLIWNSLADMVAGVGPVGSVASSLVQALKPGGYMAAPLWSDFLYGGTAFSHLLDPDKSIADNDWKDAVNILQAAGYVHPAAAQAGAVARESRKWYRVFSE